MMNKCLSFAGRLQLIKSVITSISNFPCSVFRLPSRCLDTIESLCSDSHKAKVSWEDLCFPKEEGGLGLRRLRDSSRVFALSLIWLLFSLSGSLWLLGRGIIYFVMVLFGM
ncbi:putative ribonuclease H protein [Cardamine amara subsp. amara]|uniref:Ribonuclease H protein n=1 Tax=Cardamine amara subsp. amara TaxID=228776 RepID=A0ABD0Z4S7_CARAN